MKLKPKTNVNLMIQACNAFVLKSGSYDQKAAPICRVLSHRNESLLKTPKSPIITTNPSQNRSGSVCAWSSALWNTCDNSNSALFCFGKHKSGMEVQHVNGIKLQQVLLKLSDSGPFGYRLAGKREKSECAVVCWGLNGR